MAATHLTADQFRSEIIDGKKTALVDFWASWCGPCKMIGPMVDTLADELDGQAMVGKINVDDFSALAEEYGVMHIPTIVAFRGGQEIGRVEGVVPKERLEDLLK